MTLKEYLEDYASADTKAKGEAVIANELSRVANEKIRGIAADNLIKIAEGTRDFRF